MSKHIIGFFLMVVLSACGLLGIEVGASPLHSTVVVEDEVKVEDIDDSGFYGDGHYAPVEVTHQFGGYGTRNVLYKWNEFKNYYLAEYVSPLGEIARGWEIGDVIYTVILMRFSR